MDKTKLSRREMKSAAKKVLKKHYWILVVLCLILSFFNVEFASSMDIIELSSDAQDVVEITEGETTVDEQASKFGVDAGAGFYDFVNAAAENGLPETIQAMLGCYESIQTGRIAKVG